MSQATVSRLERGCLGKMALRTVERAVICLGADLDVRVRWRGEELDRLLDATHAAMVERLIGILVATRLGVRRGGDVPDRRERGSVDLLAWHERTGRLLVVETKSVVPDMQQMLSAFDRRSGSRRRSRPGVAGTPVASQRRS